MSEDAADAVPGVEPPFDENEWQRIEEEEVLATRRLAAISAGRHKGGAAGAAMAGAMFALQEIYEGPKQDEMVAVSESPDEPGDIDKDGIMMTIGEVDVESNPPGPDMPDASA
jgi:hypothetical protein